MNLRTELEKKIEKKNQDITALERQIGEARAFVLGLQEALKSVPKDPDRIGTPAKSFGQFRAGTDMAKARDYIFSVGKPAHITDIVTKGLGKEATKANTKSVAGALNNYAREGRVFVRTEQNTFFLLELQSASPDIDLPDDFGMDEQDAEEKRAS